MARQALGRGLEALFEGTAMASDAELLQLPIAQIRPNPYQPRQHFDLQRLQELAQSIKAQGVMQPIVVRPCQEGYELIVGERRLRAAQLAGYETIPALVRKVSDREVLELALLENLQRDDLNPLEEARAYQRLLTEFQLRQEDIAQRVGKDRSSVANVLRLLKLPAVLQADIEAGRLSMGHARALLALASEEEQLQLRDQILTQGLSVRATEARAQQRRRGKSALPAKPAQLVAVEEALQRRLGMPVAIKPGRRSGKIEITYRGEQDLSRLLALLHLQADPMGPPGVPDAQGQG